MAQIESTQKAKLHLNAHDYKLTTGKTDDYYLRVQQQKCLDLDDLAREAAAMSTRQEDPEDIARITRQVFRQMMWFLSEGYSISLPIGYFRLTAQGVFSNAELNEAIDRDRIGLTVRYSMGEDMRTAIEAAELDVNVQKTIAGPQLFAVVSGQDAEHPDVATRGEGVPVSAGQTCVIKGKNIKVGGEGAEIGVTITRQDGSTGTSYFFPVSKLYPNTNSRVGFVMPADAPEGSVWSVMLCTQLGTRGQKLLKEARTAVMDDNFIVGEVGETTPGIDDGDDEEDGNQQLG